MRLGRGVVNHEGANGSTARGSGRLLPAALVLAAVVALSLLPARAERATAVDPHAHFRISRYCPRCHVYAGETLAPDRFVSGADAFCLECHLGDALGRSHRRNIRPGEGLQTIRPPQDFRLDEEGRILCLTCHTGHGPFLSRVPAFAGQGQAAPGLSDDAGGRYRTYYARRSDPREGFAPLCRVCHPRL